MGDERLSFLENLDLASFLLALLLILAAAAAARGSEFLGRRALKRFPQYRLRIEQVVTVSKFLLLLGGVLLSVLALFGFSKEMILAVGGSMAVAVGFGLKDIAASVLSGFLILFERPFQVGDRIKFGETYGDVVSIGLRSIRVRTLDDSMVTIPNSRFITDSVASANAGQMDMMAQVDIHIDAASDFGEVEKLVRESVVASRYVYLEKPIRIFFDDVFIEEHFCTRVRIKAYVIETAYEKPFASDLTRRLHDAFARHGICFPSRTGAAGGAEEGIGEKRTRKQPRSV